MSCCDTNDTPKGHRIPELLAPVGNVDQLDAALLYGANAIYVGGTMSLRATRFFTGDALEAVRARTREVGVAMYYCCNAYPRPHTWHAAVDSLEAGAHVGVDAFIIADPGLVAFAQKNYPHIPIHLSTQANTCNADTVRFWQDLGVTRVNLARELRLSEIYAIRRDCPDIELECFVHGAQCLAISGHCLISEWLNNRPANAGECTQPCRFEYRAMPSSILVVEEAMRSKKSALDEVWHVTQGREGFSAFWAPEDLCLLPFVPWFMRQGINSLKIEGRMRTGVYVAHVLEAYKRVLHYHANRGEHASYTDAARWRLAWKGECQKLIEELTLWASRPLSSGFFMPYWQKKRVEPRRAPSNHSPVLARVEECIQPGSWRISVRGQWDSAHKAQVFLPGGERPQLIPGRYTLENHHNTWADILHSGTEGTLHCELENIPAGAYIESVFMS